MANPFPAYDLAKDICVELERRINAEERTSTGLHFQFKQETINLIEQMLKPAFAPTWEKRGRIRRRITNYRETVKIESRYFSTQK